MRKKYSKKIRFKNINGSGCVTKLQGRRNKPWVFKYTEGIVEGKQVQKSITFETREEALDCQRIYVLRKNKSLQEEKIRQLNEELFDKLDVKIKNIPTVLELYNELYENELQYNLSQSMLNTVKTMIKKIPNADKTLITNFTFSDCQEIIDSLKNYGYNQGTINQFKSLVNKLLNYAVFKGYIKENYVKRLDVRIFDKHDTAQRKRENNKRVHNTFTREEIEFLKQSEDILDRTILVYIYTGMRKSELTELKWENIHLDDNYVIGGNKTTNGKDRIICIHKDIQPYIKDVLEYAIGLSRSAIEKRFLRRMTRYGMKHTMHDMRYTFATITAEGKMDRLARSTMIGHSSRTITDRVYTQLSKDFIYEELNKVIF